MGTHILLAEDDSNLGILLKEYLEVKGYTVELCNNGQKALESFKLAEFQFCILDVMMPIKDGFTLAKEIRAINVDIPILFLTARAGKDDIIEGFQSGADDYLAKPFSMEELLVRIQAILRRSKNSNAKDVEEKIWKIGKFSFNPQTHILVTPTEEKKLTTRESELLDLLCTHANDVLERTYALQKIWHDDSYFNGRNMDVYITKLRKYLKDDESIEILNIHGRGFKLIIKD